VLARQQSQPGTQFAPAAELPRVADRGNQRGGGQRTNSLDRHQTPGELVRAGDAAHEVARLCYTAALSEAAAVIVLTGISAKSRLKYGERGYRFTLLEAGHIAQNALLAASALMLDACSIRRLYRGSRAFSRTSLPRCTTYDVVEVRHDAKGNIDCILTASGGRLKADLYIDSTGFGRLLIGKIASEQPFHSYAGSLLCARAVVLRRPYRNDADKQARMHP
jgi:hypothetical protein